MSAKRETHPEWIVARMREVFARYDDDDVGRALPALIMQMCGEFGFENLDPDFQEMATRIAARIGLSEGQSPKEMETRVTEYIRELDPNPRLFAELNEVFRQHDAAMGEERAEAYQERFDRRPERSAPAEGDQPPEGSLAAEALARAMTGKIKS